jgi:hypothetical protein
MDYYRPDLGILGDYKIKVPTRLFSSPPENYVAQLNIYAWMIRTGCTVMETGEVLQGPVQWMFLFPKSHMASKRVFVPLWTPQQTEAFVNTVYSHYEAAREHGTLPPRGHDPAQDSFCTGWCQFKTLCMKAGGEMIRPPYDITELIGNEIVL